MNFFYVYILSYPDGRPFYVGKGTRNRYTFYGNAFAKRVVNKIRCTGGKVGVTLFPCQNEATAFERERRLVGFYGRRDNKTGILCNLSAGGDGPSAGWTLTKETSMKMSKAGKRKWAKSRETLLIALRKVHQNPERNRRISEANKKNWSDGTFKKMMSMLCKKRWSNPTFKNMMSKSRRKAWANNPIRRKRMSAQMKRLWADKTYRQKVIKSRTGLKRTEETKRKISEGNRRRWANWRKATRKNK
mgnify:CR=1 FL=1